VSSQYVFGADEYFGNVYAFPIGSTRSAYTIGGLFPQAMVTDRSGNLYVALVRKALPCTRQGHRTRPTP